MHMLIPEIIIVNYLLLFLTVTDFIRNTKKGPNDLEPF